MHEAGIATAWTNQTTTRLCSGRMPKCKGMEVEDTSAPERHARRRSHNAMRLCSCGGREAYQTIRHAWIGLIGLICNLYFAMIPWRLSASSPFIDLSNTFFPTRLSACLVASLFETRHAESIIRGSDELITLIQEQKRTEQKKRREETVHIKEQAKREQNTDRGTPDGTRTRWPQQFVHLQSQMTLNFKQTRRQPSAPCRHTLAPVGCILSLPGSHCVAWHLWILNHEEIWIIITMAGIDTPWLNRAGMLYRDGDTGILLSSWLYFLLFLFRVLWNYFVVKNIRNQVWKVEM